jgi:hypothetical protein
METGTLTPTRVALLVAFRLHHLHDLAAQRAADRVLEHLGQEPIRYELVGERLRVGSFHGDVAAIHTCTATRCSCRGGHYPWCQHRVLRAVLLAEVALTAGSPTSDQVTRQAGLDDPPDRFPCMVIAPATWLAEEPAQEGRTTATQAWADMRELFPK